LPIRRTPPNVTFAIADTGTTGHYLKPDSPHVNALPAKYPINVRMPNGAGLPSSHTCDLDIAALPPDARAGHILPGLSTHSLLSMAKFCDHGCDVRFTSTHCRVYKDGVLLLEGPRDPVTNLWLLPLYAKPDDVLPPTTDPLHYVNNAHHTTSKAELLQYLHASAYSPVPSTWNQAIANNQFVTWPGLTTKAVNRHLPKSIATAQGHLDKARKNRQSTKLGAAPTSREPASSDITDDLFPPQSPIKTHAVFSDIGLADKHNNVVYTDLTGAFPVTSLAGNKYMLILYDYDSNSILVEPMKNRSDEEAL
jgi:hypothetical protein